MSSELQQFKHSTITTTPGMPVKSLLTGPSLTLSTHRAGLSYYSTLTPSDSSQAPKYYLSIHRIKKPDINIHLGSSESDPIVAVAYIHSWAHAYRIGLGTEESSREWVDYKSKWYPKAPTFQWEGRKYILSRVFRDENGEELENAKWRVYFVVRDEEGRLVAKCSPCKVEGKQEALLKFAEGLSVELERVIILGVCSWNVEMQRAG